MDMRKEIKLSDLFKRGSKEPKEPKAEKPPKEPKPAKEKRRKEPKPPKERKAKQVAMAEHEAPPLPEIPLMRAFNLLPKEEARQAKEGPSPVPYVLVGLAGVLVFAALAAFYLMAGTDVTTKKGQVEDLRAELAAYQATEQQSSPDDKSAALAAERVGRTSSLARALTNRTAWDRVLRELALVVPDDVSLTEMKGSSPLAGSATAAPSAGAANLTIIGTTATQASVAEFMTRLSVLPELIDVRLEEAKESPQDPTRIGFTITAALRSGQ
jgi:Tfp pilus assembly protein PilN